MSKTVCVIGAGIGGLMAGALLAQEGYRVTVLEKATKVGGSAGSYLRKGRKFPTGATIAFGLEEQGLLDGLFKKLKLDIEFDLLEHPMDIVLQDRRISLYRDRAEWEEEVRLKMHERSDDVLLFWRKLEQISETVYGITATSVSMPIRRMYDLGTMPRYVFTHPVKMLALSRYAFSTVDDLLRKYQLDTYGPLRNFLDAQLMDAAQTDCTEAALLPSSLALTIYRRGSFYVHEGMGKLSEALAQRITELGGDVLLASPVKELVYDKRQWRVTSRKCSDSFDVVINNTGVSFGHGTSYSESDSFSWGAFRIDATLEEAFWHEQLGGRQLPFALQIMPGEEQTVLDGHGPVYATFQPAYNRRDEPVDGEIMMTVSIHTDTDSWGHYSKEDYQAKKQELTDAMYLEIEKVLPVKQYVLYSEAGTPLTYEKFIGKTGVGGFPLTVRNAVLRPKSVRSPLPQLYIAGEQAFPGPGTLSSALSGSHAARTIMKEHPVDR